MKVVSETKSFGGSLKRVEHKSSSLNCDMIFAIYLPPKAEKESVPVLYWLSGLTCNDENFMQKAGALRIAAELGIAIVCPDTSPRGTDFPGEHDSYDFGSGAGFYVDATQAPWSDHYNMYDYVLNELPGIINSNFPVTEKCSISGHSMGGHGAITIALKNPEKYCSVSAFAPICNPMDCPWGEKALGLYLGSDKEAWGQYDSSVLVSKANIKLPLFVDQGGADDFLKNQLKPTALQAACEKANYPLTLRIQDGYDHSYFFISTFIEDHLRYHDKALKGEAKSDYY